jgi:hypothetical protein
MCGTMVDRGAPLPRGVNFRRDLYRHAIKSKLVPFSCETRKANKMLVDFFRTVDRMAFIHGGVTMMPLAKSEKRGCHFECSSLHAHAIASLLIGRVRTRLNWS